MKKKFFKILLFLVLFFCNACFAKTSKFVFITDVNLTNDTKSIEKMKETIHEINNLKDIDFVVFGGNNIANQKIDNLKAFCHILKKINKKTIVLLGSSDVFTKAGLDKAFYLKKVKLALKFRHNLKPNYTFNKNDVFYIVMDGSKQYFKSSNGYYGTNELFWLEKTLDKNKDKKNIVILQHFPLTETKSQWLMTAGIEKYYKLLQNYKNVKMIVSGHYNTNEEIKIGNITQIITENYSKNGAYKIIGLDFDNNFVGTYLVK